MISPYFVFHAPFIEGAFQTKGAKGKVAVWPGVLEMSCLYDKEFIENEFLRVEMWSGDEKSEKVHLGTGSF